MRGHPRLLVLRGGAIGDFIVTLPALQALRTRWPEAYIEVLGYPHVARLALAGGLIDKVRSLDEASIARLFADGVPLPDDQAAFLRSFDVVISYLYDPDAILEGHMLRAGVPQLATGSPLVTDVHAVEHMFLPLSVLAIYPGKHETPRLRADPEARARMDAWMRTRGLTTRPLVLHPGSGSPRKNWPLARFYELARRLASLAEWQPCFVLGEAEQEAHDFLRATQPAFPICHGAPLPDILALLEASAAYIGNDSGITHLAAAAGIRVVALFGPTRPDLWGPRGDRVQVLQAPQGDLSALTLPEVETLLA